MKEKYDIFSIHWRKYTNDGYLWGTRKLGNKRFAIDFGKYALIIEIWV